MPIEPMRAELQIVYKNIVDNLAAMKKQQWVVTSSVVALFAGITGLVNAAPTNSLTPTFLFVLTLVAALGVLASWGFLIKIQCESKRERDRLNQIHKDYFEPIERTTFKLCYENTWRRHLDYLVAFMLISAGAGALLIWFLCKRASTG